MVRSILDIFDRIEAEAFFILAKRSSEIENELKKSHGEKLLIMYCEKYFLCVIRILLTETPYCMLF